MKRSELRKRLPEEEYTVRIIRDAVTGLTVDETWKKDGILHRDGAPTCIYRDPITGAVIREMWMKDGLTHRDNAPATISRDPETGVITSESWYRHGDLHREDGPACTLRKPDGRVYYTEWHQNGEKIRPPRPSRRASTPLTGPRPPNPAGPGA
jgi:hypothetical protein